MNENKDNKKSFVLKLIDRPQKEAEWFELKSSPDLEKSVFYIDRKRRCHVKHDHAASL
jgi:hypothetical protein